MNVLAVGAHWDDIEIGCALSLQRLRGRGAKLFGAVLTDSDYVVAADGHMRESAAARAEGLRVFEKLGVQHARTTVLPNLSMRYDQRVMQELEAIVEDHCIDMVFTHWFGDHNTDHAATWEISRVAFRRVGNLLQYQSNAYFDNVSSFVSHLYFGFTEEQYQWKKSLLAMHETEWGYREARWKREIFDRERFWGFQAGSDYAESFMISRLRDTGSFGLFPAR